MAAKGLKSWQMVLLELLRVKKLIEKNLIFTKLL